jgi:hypothetical protein
VRVPVGAVVRVRAGWGAGAAGSPPEEPQQPAAVRGVAAAQDPRPAARGRAAHLVLEACPVREVRLALAARAALLSMAAPHPPAAQARRRPRIHSGARSLGESMGIQRAICSSPPRGLATTSRPMALSRPTASTRATGSSPLRARPQFPRTTPTSSGITDTPTVSRTET